MRPREKDLRINMCKERKENKTMERKIKRIFDFQRFSANKKLEELISQTQNRYAAISEENLGFINAAGAPESINVKGSDKENV